MNRRTNCLMCRARHAVILEYGSQVYQRDVFCSMTCATKWALQDVYSEELKFCFDCRKWRRGDCECIYEKAKQGELFND